MKTAAMVTPGSAAALATKKANMPTASASSKSAFVPNSLPT